jgi:hypothetical protein
LSSVAIRELPYTTDRSNLDHQPRTLSDPYLTHLTTIDLEYARTYLPVLAAIILSEIVRPGDTIELPLPHPRAWEDTVAYIYTGRVALTEPIRQNILYLGGKV